MGTRANLETVPLVMSEETNCTHREWKKAFGLFCSSWLLSLLRTKEPYKMRLTF